jgi:TrmH family RNA methyltransferase
MTITSHHNQKLKEIRKLRQRRRWRERSHRFVAEGEDLLEAADAAGWPAVERYCAAGSGLPGVEVEAELLASASGLGSGTRTLAVYDERWAERPLGPLCVYLHGLQDPGNVGTILRSARAFGASSVALGPGTADPFSPKAVRASMGAVFSVPLTKTAAVGELPGAKIALVPGAGAPLAELMPSGATPRHQMATVPRAPRAAGVPRAPGAPAASPDSAPEITLLIGAEREGLPDELVQQADHVAHIPIQTHSLNAAMAATVALYELRTRMARG